LSLLILAPMGVEARALRRGAPDARVLRTGLGHRRALRATRALRPGDASGVAVAGFGGALDSGLRPGMVVVASELRTPDGAIARSCPGAEIVAGMLRRAGLQAEVGPIVSTSAIVTGRNARTALRAAGALAVDMESAWLAALAGERPFVVVRAVIDTPDRELWHPLATVSGFVRARRALESAARVLAQWAASVSPRELLLAAPRASCAGVERAIEVVERTLERYGPPVYMRKEIVHNRHVVADLERRGAICVSELDEVPDGATLVFSAHGVSPQVREEAKRRDMKVIDATCPLVSKVHAEARRFAQEGYTIVLVGHEGHEEVDGTAGEAPGQIRVVADEEEAARITVGDPDRVAYLTQTTLAVDETERVVSKLRERFPAIVGPRSDDICYATQNRQDAVSALAAACEKVIVVGSRNSSNSNRLVEVARRRGADARLVDEAGQIDPAWLRGSTRIGVTAGASVPERVVQEVVSALAVLGPAHVSEHAVTRETVRFTLPREVRDDGAPDGDARV
jgi:4-hydroxy-3-methylbut-2-enyl diphosphate reductase